MVEITIVRERTHSKASEKYVDVVFKYEDGVELETSIPIEYRRTGTDITEDKLNAYLQKVAKQIHPKNIKNWKKEQASFWKEKKALTTKKFFDVLAKNFSWCCVSCDYPNNPNWARRVQDLKEYGYTIATDTGMKCNKCSSRRTHQIIIPLARGGITGYETWSKEVRSNIIKVLDCHDAYEARKGSKDNLLPDHKFPEIRWDDETRRLSLSDLSDEDILRDFQLISNQRNQQKREVCRNCYQGKKRGVIYGISYFYEGNEDWDDTYPTRGKEAEQGCIGCGWYDIKTWRESLNKKLSK